MAVQTTATTANRSHVVEGVNGFVSMRTSVAFGRGGSACRIGANQVVGLVTGEASGFFGRGVTAVYQAFFVHGRDMPALGTAVHTLDSSRPWSWLGTTLHPSEMTVELTGNPGEANPTHTTGSIVELAMKRTTCPDNAGLVRLAETDQADGQHLSGVSAVRLSRPDRKEKAGREEKAGRVTGAGSRIVRHGHFVASGQQDNRSVNTSATQPSL